MGLCNWTKRCYSKREKYFTIPKNVGLISLKSIINFAKFSLLQSTEMKRLLSQISFWIDFSVEAVFQPALN